jgi:hypothetical protein
MDNVNSYCLNVSFKTSLSNKIDEISKIIGTIKIATNIKLTG